MSANDIDLAALDRDLRKLGKPPRGWWPRNWKWFLPVLLLLIVAGGASGFALWYYGTVTGNECYRRAMEKIAAQPEIQKSLGQPIKLVYWPPPRIRKEARETDLGWEIIGSREKKARAHVFARLMDGKWETVLMEVVLPDGKKISLNDEEGGNLPPLFAPPANPAAAKPPGKPADENMPEDLSPKIPKLDESK